MRARFFVIYHVLNYLYINACVYVLQEFQAHKKQGSGFLSRVSDSLHNMSASYMMKNRPPEFAAMHDYIMMLSDKLGVMDRIAQRVAKEQNGNFIVYIMLILRYSFSVAKTYN